MSQEHDNAKMLHRAQVAADELVKSIRREVVDGCQYEGWSAYVFDHEGQIVDAKEKDGNVVISIEFDSSASHEPGIFELTLKPIDWQRAKPKKRKTRAKDLRKRQR